MAIVVGVRFKRPGKVYFFDPGNLTETIAVGDTLVVDTSRGLELGECMEAAYDVEDETVIPPLRKVVRVATDRDLSQVESNHENERNAYAICQDKIIAHKIEMKLVDVEYAFDNSKIIFYFTANGRVDFRSLVKDLASVFKTRIELRQIGVRDEAKMLGGLGPCGRPICCGTFLGDFQPVSIKMAKEQNLSLNPTKISGLCGRLMCCLKYEQDNYEEARKRLPRVGKDVMTPDGRGHVLDVNALKETAKVRVFLENDSSEVREYQAADLQRIAPAEQPERKKKPAPPARDGAPIEGGSAPKAPQDRQAAPQQGRERDRRGGRGRSGPRPENAERKPPQAVAPDAPAEETSKQEPSAPVEPIAEAKEPQVVEANAPKAATSPAETPQDTE